MNNSWSEVGLFERGSNIATIKLKDSPKDEYSLDVSLLAVLIRGHQGTIPIYWKDITQTVLIGEPKEEVKGSASLSKSGKTIVLEIREHKPLYIQVSKIHEVLNGKEWSCKVSMRVS